METKFTKEPWIIFESSAFPENEITTQERINNGHQYICGIDTIYDGEHGVEQVANAHLIAAAPDMYKMLDEILAFVDEDGLTVTDLPAKIQEIKPLLAKARGEQQ